MGIDGFACDLFVHSNFQRPYTRNTTDYSLQIRSHCLTVTYPNAAAPEIKAAPSPRRAAARHRSCPRRRHDAAAAFLAARRLLRLPPAGGPRTILPSSSLLFSDRVQHEPRPTSSDAASALRLPSRWKTGWPRSRSNTRSRRRARRRLWRRQRQRRPNPRRRRSRTP